MFDSFISLDVFVPFRFYYNLFLYLLFNTLLIKVPLGTIVSLAFLWVLYAASSLDLHKSCSHPLHSYAVVSLVLVAYIPNHSYVRSHLFQYSRERGKGNNSFCIFSLWLRIPQIIYICLTTVADEWRKQHQNMMFSQRLFSRIFPLFSIRLYRALKTIRWTTSSYPSSYLRSIFSYRLLAICIHRCNADTDLSRRYCG